MLRLVVVVLLAFGCSSCGRYYSLAGRIVAFSGGEFAPGIHEMTGKLIPAFGSPISKATVTLFHEITKVGSPVRESQWKTSAIAKQDGTFTISDYAAPGKENTVGLEVTAPGFEPGYVTYIDSMEPDLQPFFVVLKPIQQ